MPVKIFCCYAHEDELLLNKLKTHLRPLQRQGLIDFWHDRDIRAGAEWAHEIDTHLNTADIILLLVSPDFMNSDYCYSIEMKLALKRHHRGEAQVIPVLLRPIYWQGAPFSKLQILPTDAIPVTSWPNIDEALFNVAEEIHNAIEELQALSDERSRYANDTKSVPIRRATLHLGPESTTGYIPFWLKVAAIVLPILILSLALGTNFFSLLLHPFLHSSPSPSFNTYKPVDSATATANAQATADIKEDQPYPSYLQGRGYLILDDMLDIYSHDDWWGHGRGSESYNGGACESSDLDYRVRQTNQGFYFACFGRSYNHSSDSTFSDFAFEVHMQVLLGNCGGVFFRADRDRGSGYYFRICQDGTYELIRYADFDSAHRTILLGPHIHSAIATGLSRMNTIAVLANGETITLYVNKQKVDSIQDTIYHNGELALVADAFRESTEISFFHARAWKLYKN